MHAPRDPALHEEFGTQDLGIGVAESHREGVERRDDGVDFLMDGRVVRRSAQSPAYPMQLILAAFEFPGPRTVDPEPVVRRVQGTPPARP